MRHFWVRLKQLKRKLGYWQMMVFIARRLAGSHTSSPGTDIIGFYSFLQLAPYGGKCPAALPSNTVNWVVPDFGIGSGGHINIFRLVGVLEELGFDCRIVIVGSSQYASAEAARECIRTHFTPLKARVSIGHETMEPAYFTVSTSWNTAYYAHSFTATVRHCYFVQDFEPFFYSLGSEYAFAENTYRFGMVGITAGEWLAGKLAEEYGMRTSAIGFSYDRERYRPMARRDPKLRHVFFYARPPTLRRGFEMGMLILNEVARRLPDVQFILAGWDTSAYKIPFPHLNAGVVALDDLPDLYSQCDAALVLSFTNLSLLPLELMACGCPVVSNRGRNVEWLLDSDVAVLADATVEALSGALVDLLSDEPRRQMLVGAGLAHAARTSWHEEARKFAAVLETLAAEGEAS